MDSSGCPPAKVRRTEDEATFLPQRPSLTPVSVEEKDRLSSAKELLLKSEKAEGGPLTRVALLKYLEKVSGDAFRSRFRTADEARRSQIERVVFQSNLAGLQEGSEVWFELLAAKCERMTLCRDFVTLALSNEVQTEVVQAAACGFDEFERKLIVGCARISQAYDAYWLAWMHTVQHPAVLAAIEKTTQASRDTVAHFLSPYTMIRVQQSSNEFCIEPYAVFFDAVLAPVLAAFDTCTAELAAVKDATADQLAMVEFLRQYRSALAERNVAELEAAWAEVDRKWMDCKGELQVVHDIEDGYCDPLRAKQGPDFSLRFLDETYATENGTIKSIQGLICEYYRGRETKLSRNGLTALSNTMAGIYYIPFKTGCSLVFSYSGQSIPNRLDVKIEKGVKIYFDVIETQNRVEQVKVKIAEIFADAQEAVLEKYKPDAVEQLVWHVAAHEVGHAIYGISNIEAHLKRKEYEMELEEPRAELTAMFTLRRLHQKNVITLPALQKYLVHFALDGLRYFAKFNSQSLQAYIIFQIYAWRTYHKHGMISFRDGDQLLTIDDSKTLAVLDELSETFEEILACLDLGGAEGGEKLEKILEHMRQTTPFVLAVVKLCNVN